MPFGVGQSVESMLMYNGRGRPPFRLVGGELYLAADSLAQLFTPRVVSPRRARARGCVLCGLKRHKAVQYSEYPTNLTTVPSSTPIRA